MSREVFKQEAIDRRLAPQTNDGRGGAVRASLNLVAKVLDLALRARGVAIVFGLVAFVVVPAAGQATADSRDAVTGQRTPAASPSANVFLPGNGGSAEAARVFAEGKRALASGDAALAEKCFLQVIVLDPGATAAHINLGVAYMRDRRWEEATAELQRAQSMRPNDPGIELNLGLANYRQSKFGDAIEYFRSALEHAPGSTQARYLLGLCYFFTNQYAAAVEALEPLWPQQSNQLNYLYVLAIAASKSSHAELQQRAFDQMLLVGQNTAEFHLYLGKARLAQDDTTKALEEFKLAEQAKPTLPLVHYFLGRTYLERHDYDEAEKELLQDAALEPNFAYNYEDLGRLYSATNNAPLAEKYFRKAMACDHRLVDSWFGLAKLYRNDGKFSDALAALDEAEKLAPRSASLHFMRAQVLTKLGQTAKAREEFAQSAELLEHFHDQLQQGASGDRAADAEGAAEQ